MEKDTRPRFSELTPEQEARIESIEAVAYNPDNMTPFGAEEVVVDGHAFILHNFNNFPIFIGYWRENYPNLPQKPKKLYSHNYFEIFNQNKLPQIMEIFMTRFPHLYVELARLDEIRGIQEHTQLQYGVGSAEYKRALDETSMTPEERVQRDTTYSTAYNTILEISKVINPDLNKNLLHTESFNYAYIQP